MSAKSLQTPDCCLTLDSQSKDIGDMRMSGRVCHSFGIKASPPGEALQGWYLTSESFILCVDDVLELSALRVLRRLFHLHGSVECLNLRKLPAEISRSSMLLSRWMIN